VSFVTNGAGGNNNLALFARSNATVKATVQNSTFTASRGTGVSAQASDSAVMDFVFTGNAVSNNHPSITSASNSLSVSMGGASLSATLTYNISNNTFRGALGTAVLLQKGGVGAGSMTGSVIGNTIGVSGASLSGSAQGSGILASIIGGGSHSVTIQKNSIYRFFNYGIRVQGGSTVAGGGQGYMTAVVQGNTVAEADAGTGFIQNGIRVEAGTATGDNTKFCVTLGGLGTLAGGTPEKNNVTGTGTNGASDIQVRLRFLTQFGAPGYVGANNADATMQAYLMARNIISTATATNNVSAGGSGYLGTCP
jgi:hypothetical protein